MQINDGKLYLNRTWKYIYPALRVYGFQPISYLNELIKQGVGIDDLNFEDDDESEPKLFILVQTKVLGFKKLKEKEYEEKVKSFFNYIRNQEYYVNDYIYDMDNNCCSHMVVLKFPKEFEEVYKFFKQGLYSKMYSSSMVKKYFPNSNLSKLFKPNINNIIISKTLGNNLEIHGVLGLNEDYKKEFIKNIKEDFEVDVLETDIKELDYPPILREEIFNYG